MEGGRQQRNVELVHRGIDAYNRGDIEAVLDLFTDDVEVYTPTELGNAGTYRGHEGYLEWSGRWEEAWEDFRMEPKRVEPVGEDHVVATVRQSARGTGSGIEVEMELCQMYEVRDGKAARFHLYPDREAALAAVERLQRDPDASA